MGVTWIRLYISIYIVSVVWKHFKTNLNIKGNNTTTSVDINDILAFKEAKIISLTRESVLMAA